ncbi:uncharacterized protein LOC115170499, partial [Tachysurus ichikawai]
MTAIFGDQNFLSLLCYLDDLLVFGKTEKEGPDRLEMVFSRLKDHNLKLSPKKYYFLRKTVKFLGYIVSESGSELSVVELMEEDGETPSPTKIFSWNGKLFFTFH